MECIYILAASGDRKFEIDFVAVVEFVVVVVVVVNSGVSLHNIFLSGFVYKCVCVFVCVLVMVFWLVVVVPLQPPPLREQVELVTDSRPPPQ